LGQVNVTISLAGTTSFDVLGPAVSTGQQITTTATRIATGDTSEFSDPVEVVAAS
jgi:hypothetical protein